MTAPEWRECADPDELAAAVAAGAEVHWVASEPTRCVTVDDFRANLDLDLQFRVPAAWTWSPEPPAPDVVASQCSRDNAISETTVRGSAPHDDVVCAQCQGRGAVETILGPVTCDDCTGGYVAVPEPPAPDELAARARRHADGPLGIYVASRTIHAAMWKELQSEGVPIISTWLDEAGAGETEDFSDLWRRCVDEVKRAGRLVAFHSEGDVWKGAFIEIGVALGAGVPVTVVGGPPGSWPAHPLVSQARSVREAVGLGGRAEWCPILTGRTSPGHPHTSEQTNE